MTTAQTKSINYTVCVLTDAREIMLETVRSENQ